MASPGSHALGEVFGEVTLFVLDFAVNQATSGSFLWRLHDDFWFWSPDHQLCVKAWKAVIEFSEATSTSINYAKTGTARIALGTRRLSEKLTIPFRAATFDGDSCACRRRKGRFVIDQEISRPAHHGATQAAGRGRSECLQLYPHVEYIRGHLLHVELRDASELLRERPR